MNNTDNSFIHLLMSDLERYFFYNGQPGRMPRTFDVWRNFLIPRCMPVALYRVAHWCHIKKLGRLAKLISWINFYLHGIEISSRCSIGKSFYMPHASGAVIGAASIGHFAIIYHQVTIGSQKINFFDDNRPVIGNSVLIGSGAKVLGSITIGDGCTIGANSLVLDSIPSGFTVVASKAQLLSLSERKKSV